MIFSLKHKFIFIRNPRCACRSVSKALEPFGFDIQSYLGRKGFGYKHCTYMKQKPFDVFNISEMFGDDFFVFTGVRNPWERVYNSFEGIRILKNADRKIFDEHLDSEDKLNRKVNNWVAEYKTINDNINNLTNDVKLMLNQKDYRVGVDFVYRFENLETDFQFICETIGIDARLPPKEESYVGMDYKDETYREHFNKKSIDIISDLNKDDIKEYGYEF